uniref:Uncharacterized protein n=1 Tax=Timspurckia oligopyrenoides TaxID=708627 RepID=A0A7S0ZIP1_9RHOD|mmetsp:Transcript_68/g.113  ORF Transcript_68/g.113 Transcript_68/m.113 type:complete len:609 (+) Transcript_68:108-1934(+)
MGVPGLYKWLSKKYPQMNQCISLAPSLTSHAHALSDTDNLYVDINGLIHSQITSDLNPTKIHSNIIQSLESIVQAIKPKHLLFIAFDGVPPRAKASTQRTRRFQYANQRKVRNERCQLDSNCVSPGTEFMTEMVAVMMFYVQYKLSSRAWNGRMKVVVSGSDVAGEGEFKIMQKIRSLDKNKSKTIAIYSNDSDFVLLSIACRRSSIVIIRELNPRTLKCDAIVVDRLKEKIAMQFDFSQDLLWNSVDAFNRILDDFVFLCVLVGSDYLPRLECLSAPEGAFGVLLRLYQLLLPRFGGFLTDSGRIHLDKVNVLFSKIALIEADILQARKLAMKANQFLYWDTNMNYVMFREKWRLQNAKDEVWSSEKCLQEVEKDQMERTSVRQEKMRHEYYQNRFATAIESEETQSISSLYLEGLVWTLKVFYGEISWNWSYNYHYAPLVCDLVELHSEDARWNEFETGSPLTPFQHLLAILPEDSIWCMPDALQNVVRNKQNSALQQYFPDRIIVDKEGRRNEWDYVWLVPFVDRKIVIDVERKLVGGNMLSDEEMSRNACRGETHFEYCERARLDNVRLQCPVAGLFPEIEALRCRAVEIDALDDLLGKNLTLK